ncbi:MAG: protein phosphatase 2C domain-containing protein [Cyclobacteriaceae bacterium]|nr:protein phosphatase 2C domain-containing protein [Cyclobacteriaceae bacterium]
MKIFTIKGIGRHHPLHSEDHLYYKQINDRWFIGAVMDGCSSAVESYFPSTLYAKSLAKSAQQISSDAESTAKETGERLLKNVMTDLRTVQETLGLNLDEILATMLLLVVDLEKTEAHVWAAGDGYIICDGQITEIDHRNTPDYPAYHLHKPFKEWLKKHTTYHKFTSFVDLTISSDGIGKIIKNPMISGLDVSPLNYLLLDPPHAVSDQVLQKKYEALINQHGYMAYDDVSALRLLR